MNFEIFFLFFNVVSRELARESVRHRDRGKKPSRASACAATAFCAALGCKASDGCRSLAPGSVHIVPLVHELLYMRLTKGRRGSLLKQSNDLIHQLQLAFGQLCCNLLWLCRLVAHLSLQLQY